MSLCILDCVSINIGASITSTYQSPIYKAGKFSIELLSANMNQSLIYKSGKFLLHHSKSNGRDCYFHESCCEQLVAHL
jgi:hypothetical protein